MLPVRCGSTSVSASFTLTEVAIGAILRVTWYSVGIAERISIESENGAKPSRCTSRRYTPNGSSLATRFPASSVTNVFHTWFTSLTSCTELFTPSPVGSVTLSRSSPLLLCAHSGIAQRRRTRQRFTAHARSRNVFSVPGKLGAPRVLKRKSGCGFGQRFSQVAEMTLFGKVADHHHPQHAVPVHLSFRDPPAAVARDFLHDAGVNLPVVPGGKLLRAEARLDPERDDGQSLRRSQLEVLGRSYPGGEISR